MLLVSEKCSMLLVFAEVVREKYEDVQGLIKSSNDFEYVFQYTETLNRKVK